MEQILHWATPLIVAACGVAVAYGVLKTQVRINARGIEGLQTALNILTGNPSGEPLYIRRGECNDRTDAIRKELCNVKDKVEFNAHITKGLENFARWTLTQKEGLSLSEVNKILNGGDK